jgi:hypothetical protein
MRRRNYVALAVALLLATGCAKRAAHGSLPDMAIPVSCASEIVLLECDAREEPPKCKSARVRYRRGCEEIVAKR